MEDLVVRRLAGAADAALFRELRLEALRKEPSAFSSDLADWEGQSEAEWLKRLDLPVFGAFVKGEAVGTAGVWPEKLTAARHRATIAMVYVRAEHRGKRISEALMRAAMTHAKEAGFQQLELMVTGSNLAAKRVYESLGFVEYGRLSNSRLHEGSYLEDVLMTCRLV